MLDINIVFWPTTAKSMLFYAVCVYVYMKNPSPRENPEAGLAALLAVEADGVPKENPVPGVVVPVVAGGGLVALARAPRENPPVAEVPELAAVDEGAAMPNLNTIITYNLRHFTKPRDSQTW